MIHAGMRFFGQLRDLVGSSEMLLSVHKSDLFPLCHGGATIDEIASVVVTAVRKTEEGHLSSRRGGVQPEGTMSQIEGWKISR